MPDEDHIPQQNEPPTEPYNIIDSARAVIQSEHDRQQAILDNPEFLRLLGVVGKDKMLLQDHEQLIPGLSQHPSLSGIIAFNVYKMSEAKLSEYLSVIEHMNSAVVRGLCFRIWKDTKPTNKTTSEIDSSISDTNKNTIITKFGVAIVRNFDLLRQKGEELQSIVDSKTIDYSADEYDKKYSEALDQLLPTQLLVRDIYTLMFCLNIPEGIRRNKK